MLHSDINLHEAFTILAHQAVDPTLSESCELVARALSMGNSLPSAMATAPELFNSFDARLAEVGMLTGHLAESTAMAAVHYERVERTRSQIWSALSYPLMTMVICLILVVVVPPVVFNSIFEMLRDSGVELPSVSRLVMGFSSAVQSPWTWFGLTLIALVGGKLLSSWLQSPQARFHLGSLVLALPVLGPFFRTQAISNFSHALAALTSAGISLHRAFPVAADSTGNPVLSVVAEEATERILAGETVADSLRSTGFFPNLFVLSVAAGEEAGDLVRGLQNTSRLYDIDLESRTESILSMLGPMVTFLIGMIVGVVNLAVLLPLVELTKKL